MYFFELSQPNGWWYLMEHCYPIETWFRLQCVSYYPKCVITFYVAVDKISIRPRHIWYLLLAFTYLVLDSTTIFPYSTAIAILFNCCGFVRSFCVRIERRKNSSSFCCWYFCFFIKTASCCSTLFLRLLFIAGLFEALSVICMSM